MRRIALTALAAATMAFSSVYAATAEAPVAAAAVDPSSPEAPILLTAKALKDNDFKQFFLSLPAADQAQAEKSWKDAQTNPAAKDGKEFDDAMAKLLAPDAVDQLMTQVEPQLKAFDPQQTSQMMMMMSGFLPMLLQNGPDGKPKALTPELKHTITMLQSIITDAAQWIPTANVNDPEKLRSAFGHIVAAAKALDIKDTKALRALPLTEVLGRVGPLVKELKQALAVYDLQADDFLGSITAKSAGEGDTRTLTVGFKAFGRGYETPITVERQGTKWVLSKDNASGFDAFGKMFNQGGGAPAPAAGEDTIR